MCRSCVQMDGSLRVHRRCDSKEAVTAKFASRIAENHPDLTEEEVQAQAETMAAAHMRRSMDAANRRRRVARTKRTAVAETLANSPDIPVALREPLAAGARRSSPSQLQSYLAGVSDLPGVAQTMERGFSTEVPLGSLYTDEELDKLNLSADTKVPTDYGMDSLPGMHMATLHDIRYENSPFDRYAENGRPVKDDYHFRNYEIQSRRLAVEKALAHDPEAMDAMFGSFDEADTSAAAMAARADRDEFLASVALREEMENHGVFRYLARDESKTGKDAMLSPEEAAEAREFLVKMSPRDWARAEGSSRAIEDYSTAKAAEHLDPVTSRRPTGLTSAELDGSLLSLAPKNPGEAVTLAEGLQLRRTDNDKVPYVFDVHTEPRSRRVQEIPVSGAMYGDSVRNIIDRTPYIEELKLSQDTSRQIRHSGTRQLVERTMNENSEAAKAARRSIADAKLGAMMGLPYSTGQQLVRRKGRGYVEENHPSGKRHLRGGATGLSAIGSTGQFSGYHSSGMMSEWSVDMMGRSLSARYDALNDVARDNGMESFDGRLTGRTKPFTAKQLGDYVARREDTRIWLSSARTQTPQLQGRGGKMPSNLALERRVAAANQAFSPMYSSRYDKVRSHEDTASRHPMSGVSGRMSVRAAEGYHYLATAAYEQRAAQVQDYRRSGKMPVKTISAVFTNDNILDTEVDDIKVGSKARLTRCVVGHGRKDKNETTGCYRYVIETVGGLANGQGAVAHVAGFDNLTITRVDEDADGHKTVVLTSDDVIDASFTD